MHMSKRLILLMAALTFLLSTHSQGQETSQIPPARDTAQFKFERKSPTGALFRSMFVPGWGQLYTKKHFKAFVAFFGEITLASLIVYENNQAQEHKGNFQSETDPFLKDLEFRRFQLHEDNRNTYIWFLAGTIFVSMWDAYVDAHLYNFKEREKHLDLMGGVDRDGVMRVGVGWRF